MTTIADLLEELALALWGPTGFRCPRCGHDQGSRIQTRPRVRQCRKCHAQVSITARTVLAHTKLDLRIWKDLLDRHLATGETPTTTELAGQHGIARSTAWGLLQKVLRYDPPQAEGVGDGAVVVHDLRCRRPKPIPMAPSAPTEVRRLHDAHLTGEVLPPVVSVSLRHRDDQVRLDKIGLTHDEVRARRLEFTRAEPRGFVRWLWAGLYFAHRGVSLRWLPRWLGSILAWWNAPITTPPPWSAVAARLGPRALRLLDPWLEPA